VYKRNPFIGGAKNFSLVALKQGGHATHVIGVMVGKQDVMELHALLLQNFQDWVCVARIHNGASFPARRKQPDIVISKRRNGADVEFVCLHSIFLQLPVEQLVL
jgi:hypothetical protein